MQLYLYEELLLLALRDDKGTVPGGAWYKQAIGGAILAELLLEQRLALDSDGKHVLVTSPEPLGEELIDRSLAMIVEREKPRTLERWLSKLADQSKLLEQAAKSLCSRGILSEQKSRLLWIFEQRSYPELNPEPERLLIERLERALFGEEAQLDPRLVITISLADKTGLLKQIFPARELKQRRARIDEIVAGELVGKVAEKVIEAITAAIVVSAVIVPTVVS